MMALSLNTPKHRFLSNYSLLLHHFSSTSSSYDHSTPPNPHPNPTQQSNLEQASTTHLHNLAENHSQAHISQNQPSNQHQPISFQDIYIRNFKSKPENGTSPLTSTNYTRPPISIKDISQSLTNMSSKFKRRVPDKPSDFQSQQPPIFGKDIIKGEKESGEATFYRHYTHAELGEKLRSLRPAKKPDEKGFFSLQELSERVKKLNELESNQQPVAGGINIINFRNIMKNSEAKDEENARANAIAARKNWNLIGKLSSSMSEMQGPPKEHLIERYLHPDNMSSAEKMKIELAKVRDEFKMSESDCGSARVQVAQLTTTIKHLSAVLHKKDKHSRKGLEEMVQRRKKLLKYLRRTDWDSYCFVISKLGLRDNPDSKESHKKSR